MAVNGNKYTVNETMDTLGRSTGYSLAKDELALDTVAYAYSEQGRLVKASFLHGGQEKTFAYSYLPGTNLLHSIAHPNDIVVTRTYEQHRELPIGINATRGDTAVVLLGYTYDQLGRPITRKRSRQSMERSDSFAYNDRSELVKANLGTTPYAYEYDNIGNRETAQEAAQAVTTYASNPLNQYTGITQGAETPFTPEYDAAGNQTKIKTTTGIWTLVYDANNRPISFTSEDGQTLITCGYDYMGRRFMKKVRVGETVTLHQYYLYRGYLQIAALDLTRSNLPAIWHTHWAPTEPVATRPLSIRKNGTWYTYGHDLTKNVTELYDANGAIATSYDYTPYGAVTANGIDQPFQWSSEVYDAELGMVYYNYRHYNPMDGRWIGKDRISEDIITNKYSFINNDPNTDIDILGLYSWGDFGIDLLSAALVVADVILGGPTGEGIGPAIALQGMKTGAKLAAKKAAAQKAKEEFKKRAKRIAECELIHAQYNALSCKKCTQCMPCAEATKMLACWTAKAAGRKLFLDKKCDYYLKGSISFGSKTKESNHKKEYAKASANVIQCTTIIGKNCK